MKQTTTIFLTADSVNGVQAGNDESVLTPGGLMSEEDFLYSLRWSDDEDECIGAYVSLEAYKKIKKEYGIDSRGCVTAIDDEDEDEDEDEDDDDA